ncbi:MAG: hypothetical protein OEY78_02715 [Gammaproteobacteria bacterium]|nr:hypothetical protein [Gammaproteobacteria bacterium]
MKHTTLFLFTLFYIAFISTGHAEQLNFKIPKNYKIAFKKQNNNQSIIEFIRRSESLKNWTRMVTIQSFKYIKEYKPEPFILNMAKLARRQCGTTQVFPVKNGKQNGYPFSHKVIVCDPNKFTKIPETMNIKAIKGKNKFYVAQVSNRVDIDEKEMKFWANYLRDIVIK